MFCRNLEKRSNRSKKNSKFDLKMRAIENLAKEGSADRCNRYSGQSARKKIATFKSYVATKAEKSP